MEEIYQTIPHRPPFLFVDEIVSQEAESVTTRRTLRADEAFFAGHYPGNPIMPGVLSCEAVFQTGAILLLKSFSAELEAGGTPVLTKIENARFRGIARPGDTLEITAELRERSGKFFFLRGRIVCGGKKILTLDFGLAILPPAEKGGEG
ncbi:MAG: beta-hydroxyacyl-ACP dehydratase [Opitutales bacterium]|nr:beta-hydroxyacyl-ACP dehydratase [Opitutales bacterium]MCH8540807.1 beta-hydroxyacyl-ACP dehydratase [Opitutales bacterium]